MDLRPYQLDCIEAIEADFRRGRRSVLVSMATGTGKTVVFCELVKRRHASGDLRPTLVIAHREELLQQAAEKFRAIAPELRVDFEAANRRASLGASIVIASVATIGRNGAGKRLEWLADGGCGLLIVDECHHAAAAGYAAVMDRFAGAKTQIAGFTATPHRLDQKALHGMEGAAFQCVSYDYKIRRGIEEGFLADVRGYRVDGCADLSGVKELGGDFAAGALARAVDDPARTEAALRHWLEVARERRTIAFCASVEHARHVAEAFRARRVAAEAVDGSTPPEERAATLERFRIGETQVLSNCELFIEGFDVPETDCILMLRPTQSFVLYCQCIGRGTRIHPGKTDCIVIDVVDNCKKHSLATVPSVLSLPPGLDLEGQSLAKAAEAIDEMGARAAVLQRVLPGSWSELQTLLQSVDLFASLETPAEIGDAELRWMSCPGGYRLDFGEGRVGELRQDAVGMWWLWVTRWVPEYNRREQVYREIVGNAERTVAFVAREAEEIILQRWPNSRTVAARKAVWHGKPPTDKQASLLRRLGQPESVLEALTAGTASALISQLLAGSKGRARALR